jgi:hypothetical protein
MDILIYRIHYFLKISTDRLIYQKINTGKGVNSSSIFNDDLDISFDGKKKKLIDQLIYESIAQLTTDQEKKDSKTVEDIPHDLPAENGKRRL